MDRKVIVCGMHMYLQILLSCRTAVDLESPALRSALKMAT